MRLLPLLDKSENNVTQLRFVLLCVSKISSCIPGRWLFEINDIYCTWLNKCMIRYYELVNEG